jgi:hypothetical protein
MEWDDCIKMIKFHNNQNESFYDFVLEKLDQIEGQSLEMVMDCVSLTEIPNRKPFFKKLMAHISKPEIMDSVSSMRTAIRIGGLESILLR